MNLRDSAVTIRTRKVSEVLDLAFRVMTAQLPANLALGAILLAPAWLAIVVVRARYHVGWPFLTGCAFLWATLVEGVFTVALGQRMFDAKASLGAILAASFRRPFTFFGVPLLVALLLVGAGFTVVLPILLWPRLLFFREVALLENGSAGVALSRSWKLVRRRVGSAYGLWFMVLLAPAVGMLVVEGLGQTLLEQVFQWGNPFGTLRADDGSPFALAGLFVSVPWIATARFLLYLDLRTQKEGWDIQVRAAALTTATTRPLEQAA